MKQPFIILILALGLAISVLPSCSSREHLQDLPVIENTDRQKFVKDVEPIAEESPHLKPVFFSVKSDALSGQARETIKQNAKWLSQNPDAGVQIEGYCDERGSIDLNLELGEKRAEAVKRYLVELGVEEGRVSTVSYGRAAGSGQQSWAQNRRAGFFVIYSKLKKD